MFGISTLLGLAYLLGTPASAAGGAEDAKALELPALKKHHLSADKYRVFSGQVQNGVPSWSYITKESGAPLRGSDPQETIEFLQAYPNGGLSRDNRKILESSPNAMK